MKKLKYILTIAGLSLLVSCDDFLDVTPEAQLTTDVYFSDEESIDDALNRVYSSVNWRFFRLGTMYFTSHEFSSDDVKMNTGDVNFTSAYNFTNNPSNIYMERLWERWYLYLNDCNQVLKLASKYNDSKALQYNAQARYFRAYWHFDLVNVFGDVVIRDHVPTADEFNIPKSPQEDVYKLIISDLEYAAENLPTRQGWGVSNLGRVTKGTALGLLAKVYLYRQDYSNAYKYAKQLVQSGEYSLDPSYRALFSIDGKYSVESMMPGHYIYQNIVGRTRNPYVEFQGIPGSGLGSGIFAPSDDLVNSFEVNDPRKAASIFNKGETIEGYTGAINWASGFQYANKKVIWPATQWPDADFFKQQLNLPFLRYADLLLIYAEAANELGNSGDALDALEQVRFRARGNKTFLQAGVLPQITETNKVQLRQLIWKERRVELAIEGNRWFDLVRYEKVVPGYTTNIMNNLGRSNFNYNKNSKFPIPSTFVTNSNGVLIQNPNWQ
ncbi:RagB/SusD family nutrient uptake outer membrane protein [Flavobacterium gawalongense]|uniref:RagB/SusD family nutrient uptake outer membrane protein n=1 Tax=Flavobacterium gawalongense TaxID=2594432 RepID=A0ABY3CNS7_9FLAO|nr:RagB/SusD family nutrient uptake outer membrane protein [Flavobacterium gawalongense]TRX03721.1 RagB/SusD family nutrient uptake outer membrane protein [Flavobacterium gawalongense]TRX08868.1 RagB/SusD family nutrient uptake outer membrane protein [Flavobacterium gawalongense]